MFFLLVAVVDRVRSQIRSAVLFSLVTTDAQIDARERAPRPLLRRQRRRETPGQRRTTRGNNGQTAEQQQQETWSKVIDVSDGDSFRADFDPGAGITARKLQLIHSQRFGHHLLSVTRNIFVCLFSQEMASN